MPEGAPRYADWILESLSTGVIAIDTVGDIVTLNAGASRILGCADPEVSPLGRKCGDVLAAEPGVARLLLDTLNRRSALSRAELTLQGSREGGAITIGFTLSPILDGERQVRGAAMIFRDLTAFERADEQERLRERLAALGQMAAGLAHEIRNPLAGMEVLAGLLKRQLSDRPEEQALVSELLGELHVLADTVTASLDFVRPLAPDCALMEPEELIEAALRIARSRVRFCGTVACRYADALPELHADADQLRSVVTNLIVNAFEAINDLGPDGQLEIAVVARDSRAPDPCIRVGPDGRPAAPRAAVRREMVIVISDNGPGVPGEIREKVFYPFFSTKERGSGVGLAMAQKIAACHGGALELDDSSGAGATFRLCLPVEGEVP